MAKEPTVKTKKSNKIYGHKETHQMLKLSADHDLPALLIGDTGTGKTTIVKSIAEKEKKDWVRFNLTGETTVDDFVGKWTLVDGETVWNDGILIQAMKQGKWLIVDEINVALPEILFVLHSLLDDDKYIVVANNNGEIVRPHEDFRFFATMNPVDEYAGTKDLNKAFKSRFSIIAYMDYPSAAIEAKVLQDKSEVNVGTAKKMVAVARRIRELKKQDEVFYTCSTRDLLQWADIYVKTKDLESAFKYSILNKANGDRDKVKQVFEDITKTLMKVEQEAPDLDLRTLERKVDEIKDERSQLEFSRERMKKTITEEIMTTLKEKLGVAAQLIDQDDVDEKTTKVMGGKESKKDEPAIEGEILAQPPDKFTISNLVYKLENVERTAGIDGKIFTKVVYSPDVEGGGNLEFGYELPHELLSSIQDLGGSIE